MRTAGLSVGVVGASGAAGAEILRQLTVRGFPCREIRSFGTIRTAGSLIEEDEIATKVELLGADPPRGLDVAFFAAGPAVALAHAPAVASTGALVVDVSSAFRQDPSVPLVVPEVNAAVLSHVDRGIVSVPSPTAAVLAAVLAPLATLRLIGRAVVSTYQGAGSAGTRTLRRLGQETIAVLAGRERERDEPSLAFECRPMIGPIDGDGESAHERTVAGELRRVLGASMPSLQLTAVRVPVFTGLGLSIVVELDAAVAPEEVDAALRRAPGLLVHAGDQVPTLRAVAGSPAVHVGRIRRDATHPTAIALWAAADSIVKGRAGAAVSVAEVWIRGRTS